MSATPYLKNAWAKKDGDGVYWLFIQGGDLQALFRLNPGEGEDSVARRAFGRLAGRARQHERKKLRTI